VYNVHRPSEVESRRAFLEESSMSIAGFNPAGEMSQLRTQQTLAMQSSSGTDATAATAATTTDPASSAAAGAAAPGAAADASMGAAAVQEPPNTTKIILQAVMKGALTGASVTMGLKSFAPFLGKIGFISKALGTLPTAAVAEGAAKVAGSGVLGFLGKIPVLGSILPKAFAGGIGGFVITALIGAAVGAITGIFSGLKSAKAQTAAYNDALATQQAAAPAGDPVTTPDTAAATPAAAAAKPAAKAAPHGKWKSWVVAKHGTHLAAPGSAKTGHYNAKSGDTIAMLAKRFYTTPAEIRKLNPGLTGSTVPAGTKVILARKVVPDAKAWVA
jgi:LysM repeat protein